MKDEISDYLGINNQYYNKNSPEGKGTENNFFNLNSDDFSDKDKVEIELIQDKVTRITKLYELNNKAMFSDKNMDIIALSLNKYDKEHNLILIIAVLATILSPLI